MLPSFFRALSGTPALKPVTRRFEARWDLQNEQVGLASVAARWAARRSPLPSPLLVDAFPLRPCPCFEVLRYGAEDQNTSSLPRDQAAMGGLGGPSTTRQGCQWFWMLEQLLEYLTVAHELIKSNK